MIYTFLIHHTSSTDGLHEPCVCVCVCPQNYSSPSENKMSLVGTVARGTTLTSHHSLFFSPPHTKTQQTKKKKKKHPVYRMRGQIYSQSGSRVIRLDAFLEWSFLSPLLSFFEVSPRLPPLPQHSSLLFILYKYNQSRPPRTHTYTFSFSLLVCPSHIHMYEYTHIHSSRTHGYKGSCWQSVVGLSNDRRPATTETHTHTFWHTTVLSKMCANCLKSSTYGAENILTERVVGIRQQRKPGE